MKKKYISNSSESVRMFKNDFLEKLSKVHYSVPLIVFVPIIILTIYFSVTKSGLNYPEQFYLYASGLIFWTLAEYILHRFVFHFDPKLKWAHRLHFIMHGVHHDYPNDAKRLVMPPSVSLPLAFLFFLLFEAALPAGFCYAFFAGFITGYLCYDMIHYAIHHHNFKSGWAKRLKKHHMIHHYADPHKAYGVSSPLWDEVFGS
ncbi:MAG: sterol desaturase family protein [Mucilaginibacter sp.]